MFNFESMSEKNFYDIIICGGGITGLLLAKKLTDDKYEPTQAFHSWNSNHKTSNLLLINLQKHLLNI